MNTRKDFLRAVEIVKRGVADQRRQLYTVRALQDSQYYITDLQIDSEVEAQRKALTDAFADFFEADNPKFDRQRFVEACQVSK